jgi:hypothetical protein
MDLFEQCWGTTEAFVHYLFKERSMDDFVQDTKNKRYDLNFYVNFRTHITP